MNSISTTIMVLFFLVLVLSFGCAFTPNTSFPKTQSPIVLQTVGAFTLSPEVLDTATAREPVKTKEPLNTPTPREIRPCSPLQGYDLQELSALINNPFDPPPPGRDDPHQGVDFAITELDMAVAGHTVQAILPGFVSAVISDQFPYGNAVMLETPLEDIVFPNNLLEYLSTPDAAWTPIPALNCPQITPEPVWNEQSKSLYHLYAHMEKTPELNPGELVACGYGIGAVGASGNAINPHLHLEIRIGPADARFTSMSHYNSRATVEEMYNYCTWRVKGIFLLVDPARILGINSP